MKKAKRSIGFTVLGASMVVVAVGASVPSFAGAAASLGKPCGPPTTNAVTSSSANVRVEFAQFGGATAGTPCTESPCTLSGSSAAVTSVQRLGVGEYQIVFAPGTFAQPPTCTAIGGGTTSASVANVLTPPTTTTFQLNFSTTSGGVEDQYVNVTCTGIL